PAIRNKRRDRLGKGFLSGSPGSIRLVEAGARLCFMPVEFRRRHFSARTLEVHCFAHPLGDARTTPDRGISGVCLQGTMPAWRTSVFTSRRTAFAGAIPGRLMIFGRSSPL